MSRQAVNGGCFLEFTATRIADSSSKNAVGLSSAVHNEALTVVTVRVSNPDRSPLRING
jgi:hypothetical protein